MADECCSVDEAQVARSPGYRRALWIVVGLNVGYGAIEMVGGYLANSQALKADALDFLGDGSITFLALLAIGWVVAWRARSALLQGVFLAGLGFWVIVSTLLRFTGDGAVEAGLMGGFALVALAVNVISVFPLLPYRQGDANMRAVWLFSRNDAIGNVAVLIAAGMVSATGKIWPDLVVALMIAALFLHSAWDIIRDALRDMTSANSSVKKSDSEDSDKGVPESN